MALPKHVKIYIVGGYCRDRLLKRECNDHDFVVVGATPEMMLDEGFKQVGADFPVFLNSAGDEYALARTERKTGAGYHGFTTDHNPDVTLEDDLFRRDLTINAMAREVLGWNEEGHAKLSDEIIDPFGGQKDLEYKRIKHTSDAFHDDPVRVLRAARFAARLDFRIDNDTWNMMKYMVRDGELNHLTTERVWQEFEKAMKDNTNTYDFFHIIEMIGALKILMPTFVNVLPSLQSILDEEDKNETRVEDKCAILTSHMNKNTVSDFWKFTKAPNEVVALATKSAMVREVLDVGWEGTPVQILSTLKAMNAFRDEAGMFSALRVVCVVDPAHTDTTVLIASAYAINRDVNFGALTTEQQATLKGKEISDAIDALRVNRIEKYIETRNNKA